MDTIPRVQVINGDLFYSPNCDRDLTIPRIDNPQELRSLLLHEVPRLHHFQNPQWWAPQSEYLAFIPRVPVIFTGALLEVLAFVPRQTEYNNEEEGFIMPLRLRRQWLAIEEALSKATMVLGTKHSLSYWRPHPPKVFRYNKAHQTQKKTRDQALSGRDWFAVWIGLFYWMIDKIPDPTHNEGITPPLWFMEIMQLQFSQSIIDGLRSSPLLDRYWLTDRVGVYRWGPRERHAYETNADFPLIPPSETRLQEATTWITPDIFQYIQAARETIDKFFRERKAVNDQKLAEEKSPEERLLRESRSQNPPIRSALVYVWDFDPIQPGLFRRKVVKTDHREPTLNRYRNKTRIYDPFHNEWNCYDSDLIEDDSDRGGLERAEISGRNFLLTEIPGVGPFTLAAPPPAGSALEQASGEPDIQKLESTFLEISRLHYGFTPPLSIPAKFCDTQTQTPTDHRAALSIIGVPTVSFDSPALKTIVPQICTQFLHHFWKSPPVAPLADSWDLHPSNRASLYGSSCIKCIRIFKTASGDEIYMFGYGSTSSNPSTIPWKFSVHSAAIAFLICRLRNSSMPKEIVKYLLENGIRFRTLRPLSDLTSAPQEKHLPAIPRIRVATDTFNSTDFDFYKRDIYFHLQQRHFRAAVLRGGLLWRIAKEVVNFDDVLEGPTARDRKMFLAFDSAGVEYVDDELTGDERSLLCGLYTKFTGYGDQQAKASWFPLLETWESGGLNRLNWTRSNEEWFTKRCVAISSRDSSGKPNGFKNWRDTVRGMKDARVAQSQLEERKTAFFYWFVPVMILFRF
ncbi:hypothetical protein AN958_01624 [Leucoagaricus sp. SymC.cos]|nr:hypothetical protein AN958_01624 [Leucoagaricus sp. SymC.cos]